jgi:acyl CoA:acetate/3-ketoacid CoA transferase beta subunit
MLGIPTMASNFVPKNLSIELHSENGLLGMGPYPDRRIGQKPDPDWINAGKVRSSSVYITFTIDLIRLLTTFLLGDYYGS